MWPFTKDKSLKTEICTEKAKVETKKTKTVEPVKVKKDRFDITISFGFGKELNYNKIYKHNSGKSCIGCFLPFYRWFYEKQSPYYTFKHKDGADVFIRSEIKGISMRKSEIEESMTSISK